VNLEEAAMFRKKRGRKPARPVDAKPLTAADQIRAAFSEFSEASRLQRRDRRPKRQHVDDYHEVVLDDDAGSDLSQALSDLTEQSRENRHRLLDEEPPTVRLPKGESGDVPDPQHEADEATREIKDEYDRLGVEPPTHYYSAKERRETGEIDRTYRVDRPPKRRR